ncbi:hypothetical protein [Phyllobacterium sp. SB3]|uniref:hypothetical protein n=1 Tax=Phyllobacterium sp. SB3 TaxID=3156073 RepID=UPI0032AF5E32
MALTNAEIQRNWRLRRKAKKVEAIKSAEGPAVAAIMRTPFFEFFDNHGEQQTFTMCMDTAGIEPPDFSDDSAPKSATGEIETLFAENPENSVYYGQTNSLARAEIMIGQLIDATAALAKIVNDYKRDEIDARISELEQSDLTVSDKKKQAFADMARLKKMRDQLDKQVRWTFPQWKVTGE